MDEKFTAQGIGKELGTGLGLILCKDFIELNKGSIEVESKSGLGSTFKIKIPASNPDQE